MLQIGVYATTSEQRERAERLEGLLAVIHQTLEGRDLGLTDLEHAFVLGARRRGQLAAEIEQLVLDLAEDFVEPAMVFALVEALLVERPDEPDDRIQLEI